MQVFSEMRLLNIGQQPWLMRRIIVAAPQLLIFIVSNQNNLWESYCIVNRIIIDLNMAKVNFIRWLFYGHKTLPVTLD